ncbi:MAG: glycosyltransferase [Acidimicrobiales bacterium]
MTTTDTEDPSSEGHEARPTTPTGHPRPVTVGILTYRRPESLVSTLESLRPLAENIPATSWRLHDVLIVDNDRTPSAQGTVDALIEAGYPLPLRYRHEPAPGLAAARNRALDDAGGDVLAFIDDDEVAEPGWPDGLLRVMASTGAALVGGPVRTRFRHQPPAWVVDGGLFDRPEPADGTPQTWLRSGNLAVDLTQIRAHGLRFDQRFAFSGGEDTDFSLRARRLGLGLQWSATAAVTEIVGPDRTTLAWLTRRERRATANWVRAEMAGDPTLRRRALISARATTRVAQGLALAAAGVATRRRSRAAWGLMRMSRGIGSFHGLAGGTRPEYGDGS